MVNPKKNKELLAEIIFGDRKHLVLKETKDNTNETEIIEKLSNDNYFNYLTNITDAIIQNTNSVLTYWETNKIE